MKPLFVLLVVFGLACMVNLLIYSQVNIFLSGRVAMAGMLLFTAIGHFKFIDGMAMMLPELIPGKKLIIRFTGFLEIAAALGLMTNLHQLCGKLLIAFFLLVTPANVYAAQKKVNLEKANYEGYALKYLWFRMPLQVLFIAWVWYFAVIS